mmetsp:Transcript_39251/g.94910  ORF Transcript_39251/g.94910 Transcript_39251/m.94910 type:complete len:378 (-) Transcript_39251:102-1235(-)
MKTSIQRSTKLFFAVGSVLALSFHNDGSSSSSSSLRLLPFIPVVDATPPPVVSSVQVSLKGKKYEIEDVTTVEELQERLEEASGVSPSKQGRILFQGKTITSNDGKTSLVDAGVKTGDVLNCVPATSGKKKKSTSAAKKSTATASSSSAAAASPAKKSPVDTAALEKLSAELSTITGGKNPEDMSPDEIKTALKAAGVDTDKLDEANQKMKEMLESSGIDTNKMEDMVKNMMGGGGAGGADGGLGGLFGGKQPSMEDSMDMMSGMMNSPLFTQMMNDPEKLEESRQMILKNPMMKSMLEMNPQMAQIINDPVAWRESMQAAAKMYQEMDKDELLAAMKEGAAAAGSGMPPDGMPSGLFGDSAASTTPSALDELDEDD